MRWIEVVTLRAFDAATRKDFLLFLDQTLRMVKGVGLVDYRICSDISVPTDLSAFLTWERPEPANRSEIGMHLAALLREYGLIHHTVWVEEQIEETG